MKNQDKWKETKFTLTSNAKLTVNKKLPNVNVSSWIVTECIAKAYEAYLPIYMNGDLLDLGCGNCPLYGFYKQFISSVICIDWENSLHPNPYNDISCDISQPIAVEDAIFNTILISDVLEHISNPEELIKESYRILKSNGVLFINVPFLYWIHESPYDFYRYTEFGIKKLLEDAGFKIELLEVIGGALETWADMTAKIISYFPVIGKILPLLIYYFVINIKSINYIKTKFTYIDRLFPLGYFCIARKI